MTPSPDDGTESDNFLNKVTRVCTVSQRISAESNLNKVTQDCGLLPRT
jgi:hypothetical protein